MSSWELMFKLKQETDKLETVIFRLYFRVIIRPNNLQKLAASYQYNYKNDAIAY